jgi:hypothetical protein
MIADQQISALATSNQLNSPTRILYDWAAVADSSGLFRQTSGVGAAAPHS